MSEVRIASVLEMTLEIDRLQKQVESSGEMIEFRDSEIEILKGKLVKFIGEESREIESLKEQLKQSIFHIERMLESDEIYIHNKAQEFLQKIGEK